MAAFNRTRSEGAYRTARSFLLTLMILTVVNIVTYFADIDFELLFSIDLPYLAVLLFDTFGNLPAGIAAGAGVLLVYLVCWHYSGKNHAWMIAAAALYSADVLVLVWMAFNSLEELGYFVFPFIVHVVAAVYLIIGAIHGAKLKKNTSCDPALAAQFAAWQTGQAGQFCQQPPQQTWQNGQNGIDR